MDAEAYLRDRVDDQIAWYDAKAQTNQKLFRRLRVVEILAAAMIPLLAGQTSDALPIIAIIMGALGALVAVIALLLSLFQFERNWIEYRTTCETLKKEKFLFLTGVSPFDGGPEENLQHLVHRVEGVVSKEHTEWGQTMAKPSEGGEGRERRTRQDSKL